MSERNPPGDALFPESDPRQDILSTLSHVEAARARLVRHPADNVLRELVEALDIMQRRLEDRLRFYPLHNRSGF